MKKLIALCIVCSISFVIVNESEKGTVTRIVGRLIKPVKMGNGEREMPCPVRPTRPARPGFGVVKPADKVETGKSLLKEGAAWK